MAVTSMSQSSIRDFKKFNSISAFYGTRFPALSEFVVVAGGGGGGSDRGGGGGAGGYLSSVSGEDSGGGSSAVASQVVSPGTFSIIVGAGGPVQTNGSDSGFFSLVAVGGGCR